MDGLKLYSHKLAQEIPFSLIEVLRPDEVVYAEDRIDRDLSQHRTPVVANRTGDHVDFAHHYWIGYHSTIVKLLRHDLDIPNTEGPTEHG